MQMTVGQILANPIPKSPVYGLTGTVVEAYPVRSGTNKNNGRPWSVMDLHIQDATGKIKVNWWSPSVQQPTQIKGAVVSIGAGADGKGASVDLNEYNGTTETRVQVNGDRLSVLQPAAGAAPAAAPSFYQPPAQAPQAAFQPQPQATTGSFPAALLDSAVLTAAKKYIDFFGSVLPGGNEEALASCVNTMLIAVTRGSVQINPALDAQQLIAALVADDFPA